MEARTRETRKERERENRAESRRGRGDGERKRECGQKKGKRVELVRNRHKRISFPNLEY